MSAMWRRDDAAEQDAAETRRRLDGQPESPNATRRVGAMAREWKISNSASTVIPAR